MAPTGSTRVAGVIGSPVRHSLSPAIHNAAFAKLGLDWVYVAFEVPPGRAAEALAGMRALGLSGLSVTMPHKQDVARAVDLLTPEASALGAVNCVVPTGDGRLRGDNTDGAGFVASLLEAGVEPSGLRAVVLGAGGAARAVAMALGGAGAAEVVVVNRSAGPAEALASLTGARVGGLDAVTSADVVVNATSVGMGSTELPVDARLLHAGQVVADLVYHPLDTALLAAARQAGCHTVDGLGMLVHQAAIAFEQWTGLPAPVTVMRAAALAELTTRHNREGFA